MMTLLKNHLIHRCKTTKTLLIVYVVFLMAFFMMSSLFSNLNDITERQLILDFMEMADTLLSFIIIIPVIFVLLGVKMYMDYKQGEIRWALLTKNKYVYVLGDILFLFASLMLLYILYYALLRYGVSARMEQFDQKVMSSYGFTSASFFMARMELMKLIFPHELSAILCNLTNIILECTLCVTTIRYLINGKKHFMDLFILLIGLIIVVKLGILLNVYIQILVYTGLTVFYFREACKTWNVVERRNSDVEN